MPPPKIVVATHGHCFDGLASAVLFTHLRRHLTPEPGSFEYRSCGYGPKLKRVPDRWLRGDENAITDFRYTPSPRLHWYFDHHRTAFGSDEEREAAVGSKGVFYDPAYPSCASLIADVAAERYAVEGQRFQELVTWANRIDAADFPTPEAALDRSTPVMQLASVVEQHGDAPLLTELCAALLAQSVEEVACSATVRRLWQPLAEAHADTHRRFAAAARLRDDVVVADLADAQLRSSGKFHAYALFPRARYSVAVLRMKQHVKVSVGYNPWSPGPRDHDVSALCQRHGGGGHADVGAVTFPVEEIDRAREVATTLAAELGR